MVKKLEIEDLKDLSPEEAREEAMKRFKMNKSNLEKIKEERDKILKELELGGDD